MNRLYGVTLCWSLRQLVSQPLRILEKQLWRLKPLQASHPQALKMLVPYHSIALSTESNICNAKLEAQAPFVTGHEPIE